MNVCVIGTGYVGLVTGACFAEFGVQVTCADKDAEKIAALDAERSRSTSRAWRPWSIPATCGQGRLSFTTDTVEAIRSSLVIFIAVGTGRPTTTAAPTCASWSRWRGRSAAPSTATR